MHKKYLFVLSIVFVLCSMDLLFARVSYLGSLVWDYRKQAFEVSDGFIYTFETGPSYRFCVYDVRNQDGIPFLLRCKEVPKRGCFYSRHSSFLTKSTFASPEIFVVGGHYGSYAVNGVELERLPDVEFEYCFTVYGIYGDELGIVYEVRDEGRDISTYNTVIHDVTSGNYFELLDGGCNLPSSILKADSEHVYYWGIAVDCEQYGIETPEVEEGIPSSGLHVLRRGSLEEVVFLPSEELGLRNVEHITVSDGKLYLFGTDENRKFSLVLLDGYRNFGVIKKLSLDFIDGLANRRIFDYKVSSLDKKVLLVAFDFSAFQLLDSSRKVKVKFFLYNLDRMQVEGEDAIETDNFFPSTRMSYDAENSLFALGDEVSGRIKIYKLSFESYPEDELRLLRRARSVYVTYQPTYGTERIKAELVAHTPFGTFYFTGHGWSAKRVSFYEGPAVRVVEHKLFDVPEGLPDGRYVLELKVLEVGTEEKTVSTVLELDL